MRNNEEIFNGVQQLQRTILHVSFYKGYCLRQRVRSTFPQKKWKI